MLIYPTMVHCNNLKVLKFEEGAAVKKLHITMIQFLMTSLTGERPHIWTWTYLRPKHRFYKHSWDQCPDVMLSKKGE